MSFAHLCVAAAIVLGAAGLGLVAWALFWDRARGRDRCPKCWYDMAAAPADSGGPTCPECGRKVRAGRSLRRTRRRWRWVGVALFLFAAAAVLAAWPKAQTRGWLWYLPTWVIGDALPLGGFAGPFGRELDRRLGLAPWANGEADRCITQAQGIALIRRAARGIPFARPISPAWRSSYGELLRQRQWMLARDSLDLQSVLTPPAPGSDLAEALAEQAAIPYELTVRTRPVWPAGIEPYFEFAITHWWPDRLMDSVTCRWKTAAATGEQSGRYSFPLAIDEPGPVTVDMDIEVLQEEMGAGGGHKVGLEHRRVTYEVAPTLDDVLAPASSAEIDAALAAGVKLQYLGHLNVNTQSVMLPANTDDIAFGILCEIRHNGRHVMSTHSRFLGSDPRWMSQGSMSGVPDWKTARAYIAEHAREAGWTAVLRTDPDWALAIFDAKRYWRGEITIPVVGLGPPP